MHVHVEGQLGVLVALGHQTVNLAQVAEAGHAHHAGALVEQGVELVHVHVGVADEVEDHGRVDVAGAAAHHQAFKRGQTHGVSTGLPETSAEAEAPLPMCSTICLSLRPACR